MLRTTLIAAFALVPTLALADGSPFDTISACRLADGQVAVKATYSGGACDQPGPVSVASTARATANLTSTITVTGEICTMQIVPVEIAGTVDLPDAVTDIALTATNPDTGLTLSATTAVATDQPDCGASD